MRMAMDSIEGARTSAAVLATCLVVDETPRPFFGASDFDDSNKLASEPLNLTCSFEDFFFADDD